MASESTDIMPERYRSRVRKNGEKIKELWLNYVKKIQSNMSGIVGAKFLVPSLLNKQRGNLRFILPTDHVPGIPNRRK